MTDRMRNPERWDSHDYTLTSGLHAYRGEVACLDTSTNLVVVAVAANANLIFLGYFKRECDATAGAATCQIEMPTELQLEWMGNYASDLVVAADEGNLCYFYDGKQVCHTGTSNSVAGLVRKVSTTDGVLVEFNYRAVPTSVTPTITSFANAQHGHTAATASGGALAQPAITSFASATHTHANAAGGGGIRRAAASMGTYSAAGAGAVATPGNWVYYPVPTPGGTASTITLGLVGAVAGDEIVFQYPGFAGITGTITYYDGTYARSTALHGTQSHVAVARCTGTAWIFGYTENAA